MKYKLLLNLDYPKASKILFKQQFLILIFLLSFFVINNCENEVEVDWQLNDFKQDDPTLIKILREYYISYPTELLRNITPYRLNQRHIYGQFRQGDVVDKYYSGSKYGGFFIEAGAYDGETLSNTLFLEVKRNWTGILVEPNPDNYDILQSLNRKASSIDTCLSRRREPEVVDFDAANIFGGIIVKGRPKPGESIPITDRDRIQKIVEKTRRTIKMQCFPLTSIVYALGNPKIDYLSLDIEGAELEVLKTIPFDKLNIQLMSLEIIRKKLNHNVPGDHVDPYDEIVNFLDTKGYKIYKSIPHTREHLSFEVFFEKVKCESV